MKNNMMKKMTTLLTAAVLTLGTAACSNGTSSASTPANRLEAIKEKGVLQVASEPYFAPNEFIDPTKEGDERYVGSDIELAKMIADRIGVELEIVPLEFTQVLASVAEGKYDLAISALAWTPTRAEAMEMSDGYNFRDDSKGYGLLISADALDEIKGVEDLADKVLVTQSASIQETLANEQIPSYEEFKKVSSMTDCFLSVQEGKADAGIVAIQNAELYIESNPNCNLAIVPDFQFVIDEKYGGTRIGAPKGEEELIEVVNEVLKEINENGQYKEWYEEFTEYAKSLGIE